MSFNNGSKASNLRLSAMEKAFCQVCWQADRAQAVLYAKAWLLKPRPFPIPGPTLTWKWSCVCPCCPQTLKPRIFKYVVRRRQHAVNTNVFGNVAIYDGETSSKNGINNNYRAGHKSNVQHNRDKLNNRTIQGNSFN